ncbi:hypothetical protein WKI65_44300 [Streptomyces sp. MS1.AVA.3]|uniref:hypothetical protein n=1 Tax=Streptomyces decoyicus TaxID=249567 RepID=UPI0030BD9902
MTTAFKHDSEISAMDAFRSWKWDRDDKAANLQALVIERHGHRIRADHLGLLIDEIRVSKTPIYAPAGEGEEAGIEPLLDVRDEGAVVYRGQTLARLTPLAPGAKPGPVELIDHDDTPSPRHSTSQRSTAA